MLWLVVHVLIACVGNMVLECDWPEVVEHTVLLPDYMLARVITDYAVETDHVKHVCAFGQMRDCILGAPSTYGSLLRICPRRAHCPPVLRSSVNSMGMVQFTNCLLKINMPFANAREVAFCAEMYVLFEWWFSK